MQPSTDGTRYRPVLGVLVLVLGAVVCSVGVALALYVLVGRIHGPGSKAAAPSAVTAAGGGGGSVTDPLIIDRDTFRTADTMISVLAFDPQAASGAAPAPGGAQWEAIEVRVCVLPDAGGQRYSVSNDPWTLTGPADSAYAPSNLTDDNFPQPLFPLTGEQLSAGACATGWVMFAVPPNEQVRFVRYSVDRAAGSTDTAYWRATG